MKIILLCVAFLKEKTVLSRLWKGFTQTHWKVGLKEHEFLTVCAMGVIYCPSFNTCKLQGAAMVAWCGVIIAPLGSSWYFPGVLQSVFTIPMAPPGTRSALSSWLNRRGIQSQVGKTQVMLSQCWTISSSQHCRIHSFQSLCKRQGGERPGTNCKKPT